MAGMIKNILCLDTQDVLKQRAERNRLLAQQRIKQGDIDPTVAILGQQFGDLLGRGLMKKLGYEDPEIIKAKENEALQKELEEDLKNLKPGSAAYYNRLAEANLKGGRYQAANAYLALSQTLEAKKTKEEEKFTKPFVAKPMNKEQKELYQSILKKKNLDDMSIEDKDILMSDLHSILENNKDAWKKDQDKFNKNDAWQGDAAAINILINEMLEKGKIIDEGGISGFFGKRYTYQQ